MARKPKNYKPQQRRRTQESVSSVENLPQIESRLSPEETLNRLVGMFEVDSIVAGNIPETYLGSLLASITHGLSVAGEHSLTKEEMTALVPDLVIVARDAAEKLKARGHDRIHDHSAISRADYLTLMMEEWKLYKESKHLADDILDADNLTLNLDESERVRLQLEDAYDPQYNAFTTLAYIYGSSRSLAKANQFIDIGGGLQEVRKRSIGHIERSMQQNPTSIRRETTKALQFLYSDDVEHLLDYFGHSTPVEQTPHHIDTYPTQELDFTILPTNTDLRDFATGIVDRLSDREKARVDLDRVNVLASIRDYVGRDRCYYAHGKKAGKKMFDEGTGTLIDEDYIVLVIQNLDETGITTSEHALAISPIAKKHAAYLTRADASAGTWREVLSLPKEEARYFGARDLRFTGSTGKTPYSMMEEKIKALLECHPDDFHAKLRMRGDGTYRLDNCPREIGKAASKSLFNVSL